MTYAIAAAGTGGHVFPGLAIAEALERSGVPANDIVFFGGHRFETEAVPSAGYDLVEVELRGLKRSLSPQNFAIPRVVWKATGRIADELIDRKVRSLIATGGYVTIPAGFAARRVGAAFFTQEQNAHAGLANRIMSRWATTAFTSFPDTEGLADARFTGNPLRSAFVAFDRTALRRQARHHYELDDRGPVLGVVGGSLGAGVLNDTVRELLLTWSGPDLQIVHLCGTVHADAMRDLANPRDMVHRVVPFESNMERFFAASDLVLSRAGGIFAEITATGSPSILVPGGFGSKGHQDASARYVAGAGAGVVVEQDDLDGIGVVIADLIFDESKLSEMAAAATSMGRPAAADDIANVMVQAHG